MIIDAHTHIFPDKIAEKASVNIGKFYGIPMNLDGKASTLLRYGDSAGIDKFLICSVATTAHQVDSINHFIADEVKKHPDRFIGFAALHPDRDRISEQIDEAIALGLRGIKLHPDFQEFNIDDPKAFSIYEAAEGRMPILFHTGDHRTEFSKPYRLAKVLDRFPKLDVIAAHFGGWSEWDDSIRILTGRKNVYVDTCSSQYDLSPEKVVELINAFGIEKVFFGTDYPMWLPQDEIRMLKALPFSKEDFEKIFHLNFETLLAKYEHLY